MHPNKYIFPCFLHCTAAAPAASCVWPDRYCVIGCAVWTCKGVVYWMIDLEKVEICDLNRFYLHVQVFCSESSGLYCHLKGACLSFWKFWQMQMQKGGKADQLSFPACCEEKTYSMSICVVLGQWRNWSEWRARVKRSTTRFGHLSDKFRPAVRLAANQWCRKCVLQCHKANQGLILFATQQVYNSVVSWAA